MRGLCSRDEVSGIGIGLNYAAVCPGRTCSGHAVAKVVSVHVHNYGVFNSCHSDGYIQYMYKLKALITSFIFAIRQHKTWQ